MRIATLNEFLEHDEFYDPGELRDSLHERFTHSVVVAGDFPEVDVAVRWCWLNFGPQQGVCWSHTEYPACPIVLATEFTKEKEAHGEVYQIKAYHNVEQHSHTGCWAIFWLGKTEYDHGFAEFYFAEKHQQDAFVDSVQDIDWGENYPWLKN